MSIKKTRNADIQLAKENRLKDSDFESRNVGHRISIVVPEDVLMSYRKMAKKKGIGYQTLINQVLRNQASEEKDVAERLERLEKEVFKTRKQG